MIVIKPKFLLPKNIITDIGSSKLKSIEIIKKNLSSKAFWTSSHPIAGSEVSGPENGRQDLFENKWCVLIKEKKNKNKTPKIFNIFLEKNGFKNSYNEPR